MAGYQQEGIYWLKQQHKCVGKKEVEISFEMLLIEQQIVYPSSEAVTGMSCQLLLVWAVLELSAALR